MADIFTSEKRSSVMSRIRGSGNRETELRLIALLRASNVTGWRRNAKVFGKPDFIFPKARLAIFVDGCFWHSCPRPKHAPRPKHRAEWWAAKLERNFERDKVVARTLRKEGWKVIRVWECDLSEKRQRYPINRIRQALATNRHTPGRLDQTPNQAGTHHVRQTRRKGLGSDQ